MRVANRERLKKTMFDIYFEYNLHLDKVVKVLQNIFADIGEFVYAEVDTATYLHPTYVLTLQLYTSPNRQEMLYLDAHVTYKMSSQELYNEAVRLRETIMQSYSG